MQRRRNTRDATGKVRVQIMLVGPQNSHIRGNIVRCFSVWNTTVTSVAERVARALREP